VRGETVAMARIGETLVSAVVERVCGKLIDFLAEPIELLWNLKDDMESMKSTMLTIQAVLSDAEKRSSRKEAVSERLWLRRLKSAAYEIDDMLSDFEAPIPPKMSRRRDIISQQVRCLFRLN
jgi:DNA-binding transcriptional regulator PaaX